MTPLQTCCRCTSGFILPGLLSIVGMGHVRVLLLLAFLPCSLHSTVLGVLATGQEASNPVSVHIPRSLHRGVFACLFYVGLGIEPCLQALAADTLQTALS